MRSSTHRFWTGNSHLDVVLGRSSVASTSSPSRDSEESWLVSLKVGITTNPALYRRPALYPHPEADVDCVEVLPLWNVFDEVEPLKMRLIYCGFQLCSLIYCMSTSLIRRRLYKNRTAKTKVFI